jgi:hypothetical protein
LTTYTIEFQHPSGFHDSIPLYAHSDQTAISELRRWMQSTAAFGAGSNVIIYLGFQASDGTQGFVNPDGNASPAGVAWEMEE